MPVPPMAPPAVGASPVASDAPKANSIMLKAKASKAKSRKASAVSRAVNAIKASSKKTPMKALPTPTVAVQPVTVSPVILMEVPKSLEQEMAELVAAQAKLDAAMKAANERKEVARLAEQKAKEEAIAGLPNLLKVNDLPSVMELIKLYVRNGNNLNPSTKIKGQRKGQTFLTWAQIGEVNQMRADGKGWSAIIAKYGITGPSTVYNRMKSLRDDLQVCVPGGKLPQELVKRIALEAKDKT